MIVETATYNTKLLTSSLRWYVLETPGSIIKGTIAYVSAIAYIFSFRFLLKTLISPWKNQVYRYPDKGFDIQLIIQVFSSNMVSRLVGFVIRLVTLIVGVALETLIIILGILVLLVWMLFPMIFIWLVIVSL